VFYGLVGSTRLGRSNGQGDLHAHLIDMTRFVARQEITEMGDADGSERLPREK
jgi:hypothetical protein